MDSSQDDPLALEALLRWYVAMGVDAPIDDEPHDRFLAAAAPARTEPPPRVAAQTAAVQPAAPASAEALIRQAETLAAGAASLDALFAHLATLPGCNLARTATRMLAGDGDPAARVMLVGAAPEADDERNGSLFAGTHGLLLDAMLRAIGLERGAIRLANLIPWRPPGARAPTPLELALCLPFARRHIALVDPAVLVCLGERAAHPLLGSGDPLSRLRGRWLSYEGETRTVKTLVTFAPEYLLRQPLQKRRAWTDLRMLAAELATSGDATQKV